MVKESGDAAVAIGELFADQRLRFFTDTREQAGRKTGLKKALRRAGFSQTMALVTGSRFTLDGFITKFGQFHDNIHTLICDTELA